MPNSTSIIPPRFQNEIDDFLLERRIRKVTPKTLLWHKSCLERFAAYCHSLEIKSTQDITAPLLRRFIVSLEESGHNEGGIANIYRSVKAYLNWFEIEYDDLGWRNPARKVKVKDSPGEPLEPVSNDHFKKMLDACEKKTLIGARDRATLMMLLDTGMRRGELVALTTADLDLKSGAITIQRGKGGKSRTVFIAANARRALNTYLRYRETFLNYLQRNHKLTPTNRLWINTTDGKPLGQDGVVYILRRRAQDAGIPMPSPHAFRRAFARNAWLAGMDLLSIRRLLGHSSLAVIERYIKSFNDDLQEIHAKHSPVDNL